MTTVKDIESQYFRSKGFTGTVQDMDKQFYSNLQANSNPMVKWSAALGKMRNGERNAKLLVLGDSTMAGAGATGVSGFGANGRVKDMIVNLSKEINRSYTTSNCHAFFGEGMRGGAIVDGGTGTLSTLASFDTRMVFGAGWDRQLIDSGLGGPFIRNTTTVNNFAFTPSAAGNVSSSVDTFRIWYVTAPSGGTFSHQIDAGAVVNQSTTAANGTGSVIVSGSLAAHTLNIKRVSGNIWIMGIQAYDSTVKQIEVWPGAWNGGFVNSFTNTFQPWSAGSFYPVIAPDLTVIQLMINDAVVSATPLATYTANLQTLINQVKVSGDVVLRSGYPSAITYNNNATLAKQKGYRDALRTLAATNEIPFDDLFARSVSYEVQQPLGMYADTLHPNGAMYATAAYSLVNLLREY